MLLALSDRAQDNYRKLTPQLRKTTDKQFQLLLEDIRHHSLRAKKYDEARDVWQGRISRDWRFYFQLRGKTYHIITIIKHPK